jgi:prepilin-type N-terminal cleavage/methylation domain-containing protein/prepilin-type processing-associated H-X9-DG protein
MSVTRGFTLLELLVVVSVIALIAAFLIPAVQSAREAGRRAQCIANLRQIGIAMSSYNSVHDMFPPSYLRYTGTYWSSNRMSGHAYMLPYIDQEMLYNSINMNFCEYDTPETPVVENRTARRAYLDVFLCPSDGKTERRNNYVFNFGKRRLEGRQLWSDGPFTIGVLPSQATVTDGLSRTAFLSERIGGAFVPSPIDRQRDIKKVAPPSQEVMTDDQLIQHCLDLQTQDWMFTAGRYWIYSGLDYTHYNHNGSPNDPRPSCGCYDRGLYPPRSFHPGVVNVLFGDGHVEAVPNSIEGSVWHALGTYNRGD